MELEGLAYGHISPTCVHERLKQVSQTCLLQCWWVYKRKLELVIPWTKAQLLLVVNFLNENGYFKCVVFRVRT